MKVRDIGLVDNMRLFVVAHHNPSSWHINMASKVALGPEGSFGKRHATHVYLVLHVGDLALRIEGDFPRGRFDVLRRGDVLPLTRVWLVPGNPLRMAQEALRLGAQEPLYDLGEVAQQAIESALRAAPGFLRNALKASGVFPKATADAIRSAMICTRMVETCFLRAGVPWKSASTLFPDDMVRNGLSSWCELEPEGLAP